MSKIIKSSILKSIFEINLIHALQIASYVIFHIENVIVTSSKIL
jgi:hypothetical protein